MRRPAWTTGFAGVILPLLLTGCRQAFLRSPHPAPGGKASRARQSSADARQSPSIARMEAEVRRQINAIRQQHGLQPLAPDAQLAQVARAYSRLMATKNFFSHTAPSGTTTVQRVQSASIRFTMLGENLFKSVNATDPVSLAVQGWMNSPGHRANILRRGFSETGVGIWRAGSALYITQLFLRP